MDLGRTVADDIKPNKRKVLLSVVPLTLIVVFVLGFLAWGLSEPVEVEKTSSVEKVYDVELPELRPDSAFPSELDEVKINGNLYANGSVVLASGEEPNNPVVGQIYYDTELQEVRYYNGTEFISAGAQLTIQQNAGDTIITGDTLPQGLAVSDTPTFAGVNLTGGMSVASGGTGSSSFTQNGILYGNGSGDLQVTSAPAAGQILVGSTGGAPTFRTISGDISVSSTGVTSLSVNSVGALELQATGITAGTYGSATDLVSLVIDADGRITGVTEFSIASLGAGDILQNGNTFGATMTIGTNDSESLVLETSGFPRLTIDASGAMTLQGTATFQNAADSTSGFQILDQDGGTPVFNVDTTNERVGIGTATPGVQLDVAGAIGTNGSALRVIATTTNSASIDSATFSQLTVSPSGASTSLYAGLSGTAISSSANLGGGVLGGVAGNATYSGTAGLGAAFGLLGSISNTSTGTISQAVGIGVASAGNSGGGTITSNFGILVQAQTSGASNYGVSIDAASTQTLWLTGNGGTASTGIGFGSARDTNLYRSAANTLRTDDNFVVALDATVSGGDLTLGVASTTTGTIALQNSTNAFAVTITAPNQTVGSATISLPNTAGVADVFCLVTISNCGDASVTLQDAYINGNSISATDAEGNIALTVTEATSMIVNIAGSGSFQVQDSTVAVLTVADGGAVTFQNTTDSANGFRILDADGGTSILAVDTINERVSIGGITPVNKLEVYGSTSVYGSVPSVLTGSIDATASTTVTGAGTLFLSELRPGDRITVSGETRYVTAIASDTSLTVSIAFTDTAVDFSVDRTAAIFSVNNVLGGNEFVVDQDVVTADRLQLNTTNGHDQCFTIVGSVACDAQLEVVNGVTTGTNSYGIYTNVFGLSSGTNAASNVASHNSLLLGGTAVYTSTTNAAVYANATANTTGGSHASLAALQAIISVSGTTTVANGYGLLVQSATSSSILTNNYGLLIQDQTAGTSDYGLAIAGADTYALWLGSGADNTDAANGITFGASGDTNLYRSAASTLRTNDTFVADAGVSINSTGTVGTVERLRVNTPNVVDNSANAIITTSAAASKGLVIQASAAQTGNLLEIQDSTGMARGYLDSNANLSVDSTVKTRNTNTASVDTNTLTLQSGNALGVTSDSGDVVIDSGTATGTTGAISIGETNASAINIGSAAIDTTVAGNLLSGKLGVNTATIGASELLRVNTPTTEDAAAVAIFSSAADGEKVLVIQGVIGQSANLQEWQDSTGAPMAYIAMNGDLYVGNATIDGDLRLRGHMITENQGGGSTTASAGANAGAGASVNISGTDVTGLVTIDTGTGSTAGEMAVITFANAYGSSNTYVTLTPANGDGPTLQYYVGASDVTAFTIDTNNAPVDSTTYEYYYHVIADFIPI